MDAKSVKPIAVGKCQMDKQGKVKIPKNIRQFLAPFLEIENTITMNIRLMPNGTIELAPVKTFEASFYMESDPRILEGCAKGYINGRKNKFVPKEEIEKLLKE